MSLANDKENVKRNKRPFSITVIAILILVTIPLDLLEVITLDKNKYQDAITLSETLIKDGEIKYRNIPVYWEKQNDFARKRIIADLNTKRKIVSKFYIYRNSKILFIVSSLFLLYGFWNLKKWIFIIIAINMIFAAVFNNIFIFIAFMPYIFLFAIAVISFICMALVYKKYFIY
ncbi:MAG: hypothetical protein ABIH18_03095 [Candidatus Omnitrophota bacterium]